MTDARLTKAAHPLTLLYDDNDGVTREVIYEMTPMSDKDMVEVDEWLRANYIRTARSSLPSDATQLERDETLTIAMREAQSISFMSGQGAQMIGTVSGLARLIWQTVKHRHPDVSYESLRSKLFNPANVREGNRVWKQLNLGKKGEGENESKGKSRAQRKHSKRKRKSTKP